MKEIRDTERRLEAVEDALAAAAAGTFDEMIDLDPEAEPDALSAVEQGINMMDSYISRSIRDISLIARLMGVETVISGMSPVIAMTLVEMGMDMSDLRAALNLEAALALLAEHHREEEEDIEPVYEVLVEASELEFDGGPGGNDSRR